MSMSRFLYPALALLLLIAAPVSAQQPSSPPPGAGPGAGPGPRGIGPGGGWGPGMMMGPGMMSGQGMWGRGGFGGMCSPRAAGLAEWRIDRIQRRVKLTDAQRPALDELRSASQKAAETIAAACPQDFPSTSSDRLSLMEKRMEAMLQAIKTVRPAFDKFYATLTPEQKASFDGAGPRNWGWRNWGR
jgi:hypothetical protein